MRFRCYILNLIRARSETSIIKPATMHLATGTGLGDSHQLDDSEKTALFSALESCMGRSLGNPTANNSSKSHISGAISRLLV